MKTKLLNIAHIMLWVVMIATGPCDIVLYLTIKKVYNVYKNPPKHPVIATMAAIDMFEHELVSAIKER